MKSEVCKKANELIRKGYNRSQAFKEAWYIVKFTVKASDLEVGTAIRIEWGDYGNNVECTVTSKSDELVFGEYYVVKAVTATGMDVDFCVKPDELIDKVA